MLSVLLRFLILIALTSLLSTNAIASEYAEIGVPDARIFTSNEHAGGTQLWTLAQTENGLIYSGGNSGIVEWDGERWLQYPTPGNTRVRSISIGNNDRLYVGTTNDFGFFESNDIGILQYQSLLAEWPTEKRQFGEIWATAANDKASVFASDHAIYLWNGTTVQTILEDNENRLGINTVFATDDGFIFKRRLDPHVYKIQLDRSNPTLAPYISITSLTLPANTTLRKMIESRDNRLIAFTSNAGIFEAVDGQFIQRVNAKHFGDDSYLSFGMQTQDGFYYATTFNHGLFILDEEFNIQRRYTADDNLETEGFYSAMEDNQNNIWLSGRVNIVKFVPPHVYSTYAFDTKSSGTENIDLVRGIPTVAGYGLFSLRSSEDPCAPASFTNLKNNSEFNFHFIEYKNHLIYSERPGIHALRLLNNETEYNGATKQLLTQGAPFKIVKEVEAKMFAIHPISQSLFVTTFAPGLLRIDYIEGEWRTKVIEGTNDYLDRIEIDNEGVIWVGTPTQELYRIENAHDDNTPTTVQKFADLPPNNVLPFKLSTGIVFGTDNGIMKYDEQTQRPVPALGDFPEKFLQTESPVFRLLEDAQGRIWYQVGNSRGYLQPKPDGSWHDNDKIFNAMPNISVRGFARTGEDILWYALANGPVYRIDFTRLQTLPEPARLHIRQISNINTNGIIYGGLSIRPLRELDQQTNSIRIKYALSDNSNDNQTLYRYRLLGSSNERWSVWSSDTQKDFTELRGAHYAFELEAKDGWGRTVSTRLALTVLPPWYLSKSAWLLYFCIALLMLILSGWLTQRWRTRKLQEQNLMLEHTVEQRTREVSAKVQELKEQQTLKDRFFANVSHEFRTPLTLTIGPLETVLSKHSKDINQQVSSLTSTALNNANKMLALIGQVLDINRLDVGKLPLRVSQFDIADLLRNLQLRFSSWAQREGQSLRCENCDEPLLLYFDQDQIEKCVSNLLSNAIKYSGKNSHIIITLTNDSTSATVQVRDNGKGISSAAKSRVFERYYQDKNSEQSSTPGTGIGLSLVKELMELHGGKVSLDTAVGKGCCFNLHLKKGKTHFSEEQLIEPIEQPKIDAAPYIKAMETHQRHQKDKTTLLIVDDNAELLQFMSLRLSANYRILQATNGEEGLHSARKELPDLIISDVMMPRMTGYELAKALKSEKATRCIPLILLTAKASKRDTVEGFASGADDYISKPFDTSELIMRVNAQISIRKTIRESIIFEQNEQVAEEPNKSEFAKKVQAIIFEHLSQPEFTVEQLSSLMFMSRATLLRKFKTEMAVSPRAYIIDTRIQQAKKLLTHGELNMSEIAYAVGFESLSYFSKSFKTHTGKAPSEY